MPPSKPYDQATGVLIHSSRDVDEPEANPFQAPADPLSPQDQPLHGLVDIERQDHDLPLVSFQYPYVVTTHSPPLILSHNKASTKP